MRKYFLIPLCFLAIALSSPAQKIKLKIQSVTATDGEAVLAFEWKPYALVDQVQGGGSPAKPIPESLILKKLAGKSTNQLLGYLVKQTVIPAVVIEWYVDDLAKDPFYRITALNAKVSRMHYLSPECPTCLKLEHEIGFAGFESLKVEDLLNNISNTWNAYTENAWQ